MQYRIVYPDELNHYGVRGMKWGVRKQAPLVGRRQGGAQKQQLNDAQKSQIRRERAKKAAVVGGTLAVAGLAAYGGYKLRSSAVQSLSNKYKKYAADSLKNASAFRKSASEYSQLADVNRLRAMKAGSRGDFDSHRMFMNNFRSNYEMSRKRDTMADEAYKLADKLTSQTVNKKFDKGELSKEMVDIARNKLKKRK